MGWDFVIDDVTVLVGASSACVAAGLTWAWHVPVRRRAEHRVQRARTRAEQADRAVHEQAERTVQDVRDAARQEVDEARAEAAESWSQLHHVMAELEHLAELRVPAVVREVHGVRVPSRVGLRRPDVFDGSEAAGYLDAVEEAVRGVGVAVRRQVEDSARAGVRVAAEEIQASLTRAQREIDNAFDEQEDLASLSGRGSVSSRALARVDHSVTLATHTVQRLRILTESWPGVQRANCTVAEIMEGARGRVRRSDAVNYTYRSETGEAVVEGLVVEPAIVALTELLDNATAYSGGVASTHVQRVAAGMRITVEDQGLGMSPLQLEEAERALASGSTDVTGLAEPGKLGFLVIGRLMHGYGLRVGLSPSAAGGVRAGLLIPAEHLVAEDVREPGRRPAVGSRTPAGSAGRTAPSGPSGVADSTGTAALPGSSTPVRSAAADDLFGNVGLDARVGADLGTEQGATRAVGGVAEPTGVGDEPMPMTVHGLPKRQPRRSVQRGTRPPAQQEVADPELFAAGFAQLRGVLAEGYGEGDTIDER